MKQFFLYIYICDWWILSIIPIFNLFLVLSYSIVALKTIACYKIKSEIHSILKSQLL